jgi:transposase
LAQAEGENPTDEDLRRFDRSAREDDQQRRVASPIDPDSRIMKLKECRTHFSYKAEHAVDLASDLAVVGDLPGGTADGDSPLMTVQTAQDTLAAIGSEETVAEVVGECECGFRCVLLAMVRGAASAVDPAQTGAPT